MTRHDPSPDPLDQPETAWLDDEHVLEPVDPQDSPPELDSAPIVRDARGRLWKVRRRPRAWNGALVALSALILLALVLLAAWG